TISLRPQASLYARANDTLLLLRELRRLGDISVVLHDEALPALHDLDPEGAYLAWTVTLRTSEPEHRIREVFEFVEDDCQVVMAPVSLVEAEPAATVQTVVELEPAPIAPSAAATPAPSPIMAPPPVAAPPPAPVTLLPAVPAAAPTIRVDLDRVDRLIDLVGELIINQAVLTQRMTESGLPRSSHARSALDDLEQLTRELQDSVMAIRAQPVKSVFQRMSRLVREVESVTGKQVRLVTEGEATEVDKTVIERLTDPITHMIRNAIDHGIEAPDARVAAGKPAEGQVRLSARHRSGQILIEVADDGGGVNRERVRAIAIERGLVDPDAELSDGDIDNLIFAPGFSTAETISDLSGRGVGLDVVRRSVQALGGRISIFSRPGEGSTVTLSLPLTLAVMDGMVATVAGQTLVAPLTTVVQTLRPTKDAVRRLGADTQMLWVGDGHLPLIDVGVMLGYRAEPIDPTTGVVLLVDGGDGARGALVVDDIQDQRQVVIKSLEANYQAIAGVAAATILGDGRVALILDVDNILSGPTRLAWRPEPKSEAGALCA
ncbi:MAG: chemotaxis protein CheA, partial [Caulobacteraceae bacterium]